MQETELFANIEKSTIYKYLKNIKTMKNEDELWHSYSIF